MADLIVLILVAYLLAATLWWHQLTPRGRVILPLILAGLAVVLTVGLQLLAQAVFG